MAQVVFLDMVADDVEPRIFVADSFQVTGVSLRDDQDRILATFGPLGWTTADDGATWTDWTIR